MTPDQGAERLFHATYGHRPQAVWAAPGRVNLIGEHTDYNAGLVLPIALPQRTYAAVARRTDQRLRFVSADAPAVADLDLAEIAPGHPAGWNRYPAGVLWALRQAGYDVGGLDVAFVSEVPVGAGLSSSAAIEASMAAAASDLFGLDLLDGDDRRAILAGLCQRAENDIAGAPTGGMDQAAALRAEAGHALYLDCADGSIQQVPFELASHGLRLLVIDTRAEHANADGQYGQRRADCDQACARLGIAALRQIDPADLAGHLARLPSEGLRRRVRHVVTEIGRVEAAVTALRAGDFEALGRLFVESHASLRDDYEVSSPELDLAVTTALECGALGARMTGGGFGGSAIALIWQAAAVETEAAITAAFADRGLEPPVYLLALAGPAAGRVESGGATGLG